MEEPEVVTCGDCGCRVKRNEAHWAAAKGKDDGYYWNCQNCWDNRARQFIIKDIREVNN